MLGWVLETRLAKVLHHCSLSSSLVSATGSRPVAGRDARADLTIDD